MNQVNLVLLLGFLASGLVASNAHIGSRIIGGDVAKEGQFPYIVSLRTTRNQEQFCAGTIIATNVILTAGHCLIFKEESEVTVVVGALKTSQNGTEYPVERILIHEKFDNEDPFLHDVAVMILAKNITLSANVSVVKLREVDNNIPEDCLLLGWGDTSLSGDPHNLRFLNQTTTTRLECGYRWMIYDKRINVFNICTLSGYGYGACDGDDGGPLVDSQGTQIGIISWWYDNCGIEVPDVYTRVAWYIDWIKNSGQMA